MRKLLVVMIGETNAGGSNKGRSRLPWGNQPRKPMSITAHSRSGLEMFGDVSLLMSSRWCKAPSRGCAGGR